MRTHREFSSPPDHDAENGWEVARLHSGPSLGGVRMAGFRDSAAAGLDMQVLPQPAVVVVMASPVSSSTRRRAWSRPGTR